VFVSIKHIQKEKKNYMLTLGLEPIQFVSEEYCQHALTRSATSGCGEELTFCSIHPWKQGYKPHTMEN
jgi:hypothetical protein